MTSAPLIPDVPDKSLPLQQQSRIQSRQQVSGNETGAFGRALDDVGAALGGANAAEDAFAGGAGDLQTAMYERARADVALSVAAAAAQRATQALQTIFSMQV